MNDQDWPYRARNSTFRALTKAGVDKENFPRLGDVMTISEPEAAAIYTARWFAEDPGTRQFLKVNLSVSVVYTSTKQPNQEKECFVLCDAGGGTVVSLNHSKICSLLSVFSRRLKGCRFV